MIEPNAYYNLDKNLGLGQDQQRWLLTEQAEQAEQDWLRTQQDEQEWLRARQEILRRR
jgi:hypothetical protein